MQYLMLVRVDPDLAAATTSEERDEPVAWIAEGVELGLRIQGDPLDEPDAALVVRARGGRTVTAPGPFARPREAITGFDLLEAPDLPTAVDYASRHPAASFGAIEVRELRDEFFPGSPQRPEGEEHLLLHVPTADGDRTPTDPIPDMAAWQAGVERSGATLGGARLRAADDATAATVRRRDGEVLITRGPFAELAEQVAGIDLVRVADLDEAIALAAAHPTATYGAIEVRPLVVM